MAGLPQPAQAAAGMPASPAPCWTLIPCSAPHAAQVWEQGGKLQGRALVGVGEAQQQLRDPEVCRIGATAPVRRLAWPLVCGEACYEVTHTVARSVARLAINGFPVAEKSLGMFAQVRRAARRPPILDPRS